MPRKTRGWLRKMRELGLGRHGFGGWMSGSELMVQRGNLREMAVVQERQGRNNIVQRQPGLVQGKISVVQKNNVYVMLPRKPVAEIPPLSPLASLEINKWELRKQLIIQIATRRSGKIRLRDVAAECNVNIRIAAEWLKRLSLEGMISLVAGQRNVMVYSLKDVGRVHK
ncbi:putative transcriptional regulator [Paenibacillus sp. V4I9]|uniref:hypothetical protein n=1 Tax=Paenibacillus sp. V4I9 TaxID=3042308 RepID=UPI0027840C9B|nr:hypothetical protein [Paenibacillus sp. V4I9]MDQ0890911.1 putative transcriptional regulator [Paenibacillus sp. V4I9]